MHCYDLPQHGLGGLIEINVASIFVSLCFRFVTTNSDSRQKKNVFKNRLFSNYFMLAVFI